MGGGGQNQKKIIPRKKLGKKISPGIYSAKKFLAWKIGL
jgi:hypothetical protein